MVAARAAGRGKGRETCTAKAVRFPGGSGRTHPRQHGGLDGAAGGAQHWTGPLAHQPLREVGPGERGNGETG